eukprot:scaffold7222_cov535-Prasinococcus_capsulatus_cf.AAC.9
MSAAHARGSPCNEEDMWIRSHYMEVLRQDVAGAAAASGERSGLYEVSVAAVSAPRQPGLG